MSDYRFSVLMSVYDQEKPEYLSLALESVLVNQTLLPDEMILVCDGLLTDELDEVISKYETLAPDILKVYRLDNNIGLGKALNYGLEKCSYDWVARADSDDVCMSNRFEKQFGFLKKNPDIDIISSCINEFEEDYQTPCRRKDMPTVHRKIVKMAKFRNPMNHMAVVFRKKVILDAGSYQHLPYVEDYYLWVRAICNGAKLANIDEPLVHARVGNGMAQRRSDKRCIAGRRVLSRYMLEHGMIGRAEYYKNMLSIRMFVYLPTNVKVWVYNNILRK